MPNEAGLGGVETVTTAAAKVGKRIWSLPAPARHHHVFRVMGAEGFKAWGSEETGFLTNTGRYVDRKEAARIAVEAGQITAPKWPPDLYSEDLW